MAGSSDITAVLAGINSGVGFSTAAINAGDTGFAYLDVSTMDGSKVIFIVGNGASSDATLKVIDGANFSAGAVGDLEVAMTSGAEYIVGPLETARFKDSDGYIKIGKTTADADKVYVRAILLP